MSFAIPEPFAWDQSFDVQNTVLNDQHKKLFVLIAELATNKADAAKLKELLDLVVLHFGTEENLFKEKGWEESKATAHKAIHDKFVNDAIAGTKDGVTDATIDFLKNWLVSHIKVSDMQYVGTI